MNGGKRTKGCSGGGQGEFCRIGGENPNCRGGQLAGERSEMVMEKRKVGGREFSRNVTGVKKKLLLKLSRKSKNCKGEICSKSTIKKTVVLEDTAAKDEYSLSVILPFLWRSHVGETGESRPGHPEICGA